MPRRLDLLAILLLGSVLRLFRLDQQSYWADEVRSIWAVDGQHGSVFENLTHTFHGPLHYAILGVWGRIGGFGEVWARGLSVLTGLLGIWLLFILTRRLAGRRVARIAALLLAISPFHIWYSQEVRNYVQLIALSILSMIILLRIMDRGDRYAWFGYFVTSTAVLLSNLAGMFLVIAQGLYIAWKRPRIAIRVAAALVVALLLLTPWIRNWDIGWRPNMVGKERVVRNTNFHPLAFAFTFSVYSVGDTVGPSRDEMNRNLSFAQFRSWLPYFAIAGPLFGLLFWRGLAGRRGEREGVTFFLLWLLVPIVITSVLSALNVKAYNVRYVSVGFPAFVVLIAVGLAGLRGHWARLAWVLVILCTLVSLRNQYTQPRYWKPDARTAAAAVAARATDGDAVVVYSIEEPFRYYYDGAGDVRSLDSANPTWPEFDGYMDGFVANYERIWLVDYRGWYTDRTGLMKPAFAARWEERDRLRFDGVDVRLYEKPRPVSPGQTES